MSSAVRLLLVAAATGVLGFDLTPKVLFTHVDKELHCPDRELIHPCTTELRAYLKGLTTRDNDFKKQAFGCATAAYDTINDYWILKNMTHLLLDLDTSTHFFDKDLQQEREFFELGLKFGRKLIHHPECMEEFDTKGELECRCPHLYSKIIMLKLKNLGKWTEAEEMFAEVKNFSWNGKIRQYKAGEAFRWTSIQQTPQIFMRDLQAIPMWPRERKNEIPIWQALEDNYPVILKESTEAFANANKTGYMDDAYRFLFQGGNWNQILLYHGREYTDACEKAFPETCAMLKKVLPDRPQHHYPWTSNQNEQALVLRLRVGTDVETHSGPANNILNVHLGLKGTKGAKLIIANETYGWEDGKVIAWDGSYDHRIHCHDCLEDRFVVMVRYMHPGITPEHYRGNRKTHFEDVPKEWIDQWDGADSRSAEL
jgi:aspartyl/asparaginyl beta-hydroxylase (cupin superfamily)